MKNNQINKVTFKKFSKEENAAWEVLCKKRLSSLEGLASPIHKKGMTLLGLNTRRIPDFHLLNKKLKKLTGWSVLSTGIQYEEDEQWLSSLAKKTIRITEYIRDKKNLNYTPLPDIFHDAFGHLPFLANKKYGRIAHKFGLAFVQAK